MLQRFAKTPKPATRILPRPSRAATVIEGVCFGGDSNLRDLVPSDAGSEFFDGIPNHLVSPGLPIALWTVCTGGRTTRPFVGVAQAVPPKREQSEFGADVLRDKNRTRYHCVHLLPVEPNLC